MEPNIREMIFEKDHSVVQMKMIFHWEGN